MSTAANKLFVSKMQEILKTKGYEVKTSHLYDAFAQMEGFKNWHVASVKDVDLTKVMNKFNSDLQVGNVLSSDYVNKLDNKLTDQSGNEINFDIFSTNLPSWNYAISGQTGSGKSFLTNKIIGMELSKSKDSLVYIMDNGGDNGSYIKLVNFFKGEFVNVAKRLPHINLLEIDPKKAAPTKQKIKEISDTIIKISKTKYSTQEINIFISEYFSQIHSGKCFKNKENLFNDVFPLPFDPSYEKLLDLAPGTCQPSITQSKTIMAAISLMLGSGRVDDGFMRYDKSEVLNLLYKTYDSVKGRLPTLSDFYEVCKNSADDESQTSKKFLSSVHNWTKDGIYPMFDNKTNLEFNNRFILFDAKGLDDHPALQAVYTLLITDRIMNKFKESKRKVFVRDEIATLFKHSGIREQFKDSLQDCRKNGIASISISQLVTDYSKPDPGLGHEILNSMNAHIVGKMHNDKVIKEVAHSLSLSDEQEKVLKTVGLVKRSDPDGSMMPTYANYMMITDLGVQVIKFEPTKFEYQLFSSSFTNNYIIEYYLKHNPELKNIEDVLDFLSKEKHLGDETLAKFLKAAGFNSEAHIIMAKR